MKPTTVSALVKQIASGDFSVYQKLHDDEKAILDTILNELKSTGKSPTLSSLWESDFEMKPVTIDEFLDNDYYLGKIGKDIFPKWRDELRAVCDPKREICEFVIRGAVGAGKTSIAVIALLHRIHFLCCMKNPQRFYGLMEGSPIVFGLFNIYKYLAQDTSYKYFTNWVKLSPFFQDVMRTAYAQERSVPGWLQRLNRMYGIDNDEMANSYMRFPKGITVALGSSAIHALGQNLYGGLCFTGDTKVSLLGGKESSIYDLYNSSDTSDFELYSVDASNRLVVGKSCKPFLTRKNADIVSVSLTNGCYERCTPDHRWILCDGTIREAKDLKTGDMLMSCTADFINFLNFNRVISPGDCCVSVLSVDPCDKEDTYCLTVEDLHTLRLSSQVFTKQCDEADMSKNRALKSDEKTKVEELYGQAKSRLDSRFLQLGGINPGLLVLVSQVQEADSFLSKHVSKVEKDIRTHVSGFAIWEIKDHLFPPEEPRFQVVVGTRSYRSFLVEPGKPIPAGAQIIDVPESLRPRFEYSIDDAIRDQAGIPTFGANLFLPRRDKLYECYQKSAYREHPFTVDTVELSIETGDTSTIADYFRKEACMNQFDKATGRWCPKWYPGEERAIHIDLSKNNDCTGFAMGCIGNVHRVQRYDGDGRPYWEQDYEIFIDFALQIRAMRGSEIDFSKIRQFIFYLQSLGFPIKYVSTDGFQSTDTLQSMKKAGFEAKELSVDKKATPYNYLRSAIYECRFDMYEYEPFTDEITKLQDGTLAGTKPPINHPPKGSKDVSDSICGVATRLAEVKDELRPTSTRDIIEERARLHNPSNNVPIEQAPVTGLVTSTQKENPLEQLFQKR